MLRYMMAMLLAAQIPSSITVRSETRTFTVTAVILREGSGCEKEIPAGVEITAKVFDETACRGQLPNFWYQTRDTPAILNPVDTFPNVTTPQ